jgi:hypothetical protein
VWWRSIALGRLLEVIGITPDEAAMLRPFGAVGIGPCSL